MEDKELKEKVSKLLFIFANSKVADDTFNTALNDFTALLQSEYNRGWNEAIEEAITEMPDCLNISVYENVRSLKKTQQ